MSSETVIDRSAEGADVGSARSRSGDPNQPVTTRWQRIRRSPYFQGGLLLAPALVYLAVLFLYPVGRLLLTGFQTRDGEWSLAQYEEAILTPLYANVMWNTMVISVVATLACLVMGYAMAYAMVTILSRWANLLLGLIVLSFWTSLLVRTYAWLIILGRQGMVPNLLRWIGIDDPPQLLFNMVGSIVGIVNVMLPFMILSVYVVMKQIDPALMKAAASLGATPLRAFVRVYLPQTISGIAAGSILVFMITIGFFITPRLLGSPSTRMISESIALLVQVTLNWELAAALSTILILATLALLAIYSRFVGVDKIGSVGR